MEEEREREETCGGIKPVNGPLRSWSRLSRSDEPLPLKRAPAPSFAPSTKNILGAPTGTSP